LAQPRFTLSPYTTLFRSWGPPAAGRGAPTCHSRSPTAQSWPHLQKGSARGAAWLPVQSPATSPPARPDAWLRRDDPTQNGPFETDRKSTRLNSSHEWISY